MGGIREEGGRREAGGERSEAAGRQRARPVPGPGAKCVIEPGRPAAPGGTHRLVELSSPESRYRQGRQRRNSPLPCSLALHLTQLASRQAGAQGRLGCPVPAAKGRDRLGSRVLMEKNRAFHTEPEQRGRQR